MADVSFPILGADFLGQHGLMVDLVAMRLVDSQGRRIQLAVAPRGPLAATIGVVMVGLPGGGPDAWSTLSLPTVEALGGDGAGTQKPPAVNAAGCTWGLPVTS